MDSAKAREFLDKHGELIADSLGGTLMVLEDRRNEAEEHGWPEIRKVCQQEMDETIAAMRELELLRGEG